MHTEKFKVHAVIEDFDENGRRFWREEDRIEEMTIYYEDRPKLVCQMCPDPTYPECTKVCYKGRDE